MNLKLRFLFLASFAQLLAASPAGAGPVENIEAELSSAGVPNVSVTMATPAPATAADLDVIEVDPGATPPSITTENLLSPDPTAPLPVVTVRYGSPPLVALPGLLAAPGTVPVTQESANAPLWDLQVGIAVRHEIERGTSIAAIALQRAGEPSPSSFVAVPDADRSSLPPEAMSADEVERRVEESLPAWARLADVTVEGWTAGERRTNIELRLPWSQLIVHDIHELFAYVRQRQEELNADGAKVGSVTLKITDGLTGLPLVTYGVDPEWREGYLWVHPLVEGWVHRPIVQPGDPSALPGIADAASAPDGP